MSDQAHAEGMRSAAAMFERWVADQAEAPSEDYLLGFRAALTMFDWHLGDRNTLAEYQEEAAILRRCADEMERLMESI